MNLHLLHINVRVGCFLMLLWGVLPLHAQPAVTDTIPWTSIYFKAGKSGILENRAEKNYTLRINEIMASNSEGIADEFGEQDDWFEVYNYGDEDVYLNGLFFTDNPDDPLKWQLHTSDTSILSPGSFLLFWADASPEQGTYHTNFKLSAAGEYLAISTIDGTLIDEKEFGVQSTDIALGRYPDGMEPYYFIPLPTPGSANSNAGFTGLLPVPEFNTYGGLFDAPQLLKLTEKYEGATVRYTTNCDEPTASSPVFPDSLLIKETTVVRARAFKTNFAESPTLTLSFLFEKDSFANPVISLVSDEKYWTGNGGLLKSISQDIEIPAHFEMFSNNEVVYRSGTGIQLHSPKASTKQYSMRLYARGNYGNSWFNYDFFGANGPDKFKRLVLRNAGNDNIQTNSLNTHFRDQVIQRMAKTSNVHAMTSESMPVNVFVNGSFFGIYNLRERIDQYYIETHTGETEKFDLLERAFGYTSNQNAIEGTFQKFKAQVHFVDTVSNKNAEGFMDTVPTLFDVENFRDYWITQVYFGNYDWLSNNVKYWCAEDGKWQWIYWDLDHGLGLPYQSYGLPQWNTLAWSLGFSDRAWSSGYNNRVARNLLKNDAFQLHFIQRFTYLINTHFSARSVQQHIDSLAAVYRPDVARHMERWKGDATNWDNALAQMQAYATERPQHMLHHLQNQFNLTDPVTVQFKVEPAHAGEVSLSTWPITRSEFSGTFFPRMEYTVQATPAEGFEFDGWLNLEGNEAATSFNLVSDTTITAVFTPQISPSPLVINELYFNSDSLLIPLQWLEIYNATNEEIDLSGYTLQVNNQQYTIASSTFITANGLLVFTPSKGVFKRMYPNVQPVVEIPELKIASNGHVRLRDATSHLIDSVALDAVLLRVLGQTPGFSLELRSIYLDNSQAKNWNKSTNVFGSPALSNDQWYAYNAPQTNDLGIPFQPLDPMVRVESEQLPYEDADGHSLYGIRFAASPHLGLLQMNQLAVKADSVYPIAHWNLMWHTMVDSVDYPFCVVDYSGMVSTEHTLHFSNGVATKVNRSIPIEVFYLEASREISVTNLPASPNPVSLSVWNFAGQQVLSQRVSPGASQCALPAQHLGSGIYIVRVSGATSSHSVSLLIQP